VAYALRNRGVHMLGLQQLLIYVSAIWPGN